MLLQPPMVENSLKHGLAPKLERRSHSPPHYQQKWRLQIEIRRTTP